MALGDYSKFWYYDSTSDTITVKWTYNEGSSYYADRAHFCIKEYPSGKNLFCELVTFSRTVYSPNNTYVYRGLTSGTQYKCYVEFYDGTTYRFTKILTQTNSSSDEYYPYTKNRPSNWQWYTSKVSGGTFSLTANEWNNFCANINKFRKYKNKSTYNFTTATSGGVFYAYMFNEARNAINEMSPPTSVPSAKYSGDTIYANDLNRLRDSLNSIQ